MRTGFVLTLVAMVLLVIFSLTHWPMVDHMTLSAGWATGTHQKSCGRLCIIRPQLSCKEPSELPNHCAMTERFIFWPLFFTSQLLALAWISWVLLAQCHFAYPVGYRLLGLDQTIAQYAPHNRFKADFEFTTPPDHWRLFGQISDAVHAGGKGLAEITYPLKNGQPAALLHAAEIIHLQDVAHLIDVLYGVGMASLALWFVLIFILWQRHMPWPPVHQILRGFLVGFSVIATAVFAIGPTAVFYWFHEQAFPAGHQWFFYYQDSLMTTLMKAPDIFAFIAVLLLAVFTALWCVALYGLPRLLKYRPGK